MNTLTIIEENCKTLAEQRAQLRRRYEAKLKAMLAVNAEHDETIRRLQAECTVTRTALLANLETGRELFKRPKSRGFHGITVGFEKQRCSITMPDETILVDRITKLLPAAQAESVLDRSVSLIRAAFKKLPREALQKLGCSLVSGADRPIVHANDDDIEALVQKSVGEV
ncbi:MAG TPA: hypothetical protein VG347_04630 [Verrucomicrobiae bacterium]|nr:hypothetical protein [Verrucomicrobiae bacterium]